MKKEILTFVLLVFLHWNGFSQAEEKISFEYNSLELSNVIEDLDERYDLSFSHANHPELLAVKINAQGEGMFLEDGLEKIFDNRPIQFRILAGQVVLRYDEPNPKLGVIEPIENLETPKEPMDKAVEEKKDCLLYTSPSPRDRQKSRMPSSA